MLMWRFTCFISLLFLFFFAFKPIGVLLITFHSHSCWRFRKIQFRISLSWFSICEIISLHRFISFPRAFSPLLPLTGTHRHFALMYWLTATANRNNWQVISRRQKMKKEKKRFHAIFIFHSSIKWNGCLCMCRNVFFKLKWRCKEIYSISMSLIDSTGMRDSIKYDLVNAPTNVFTHVYKYTHCNGNTGMLLIFVTIMMMMITYDSYRCLVRIFRNCWMNKMNK